MLDTLESADLLLGDAFYAIYFLLCALQERGADGFFEQQGARLRSADFRRGQRLGRNEPRAVKQRQKSFSFLTNRGLLLKKVFGKMAIPKSLSKCHYAVTQVFCSFLKLIPS